MRKIILALTALLLFSSFGFSQTDEIMGQLSIKTQNGFLFIDNNEDKSFSLEVAGEKVETRESAGVPMFVIDGMLMQILSVPLENFAPKDSKLSEEQLLEEHKKWESDFLGSEVYGEKLKVISEKVRFGERNALFWGFTRPGSNKQFKQDYFLTTVVGKSLVAIGSPLEEKDSVEAVKKALSQIMATLKVSDKPFDIKKLSESFRKSGR